MLHDFMSSVQSAQSQLSALCTCVEDYVDKMLFLDRYMAGQKALDAACTQVGMSHIVIHPSCVHSLMLCLRCALIVQPACIAFQADVRAQAILLDEWMFEPSCCLESELLESE
jgi:hypothetical protein